MKVIRLSSVVVLCLLASTLVLAQPKSSPSSSSAPAGTSASGSWLSSKKLADGVWCIDDNGSDNMYLIEGKEKALLVDTGLGVAKLSAYVKTLTSKPLLVVNTHGHPDHAGANYQFKTVHVHPADADAARQVASREARSRSVKAQGGGKATADLVTPEEAAQAGDATLVPVKEGFVFDLGGRTLEVIEMPGHTPGEIVLLDRANKQLFSGDNDNTLVWLFLPNSLPLDVYLGSLQKLEKRRAQFATIYPGHGAPLPAAFVSEQIACVESILAGTCKGEPYQSVAGDALSCKLGNAAVAFNPKNLRSSK